MWPQREREREHYPNGVKICPVHKTKIDFYVAAEVEKAMAGGDGGASGTSAPGVSVEQLKQVSEPPTTPAGAVEPAPTDSAADEIFKFCGICTTSKPSDSLATCPNCRDYVLKAELSACKDCQLARQADPNATSCEMHFKKYLAACVKARELTDADDASAKGAPTALAGAIEPPASSGSAKGARRWPCDSCKACQPKEGSRYCARCDVVVSVRDSYFDETNSCLRCKVSRFNATGNYCDNHRAEINAEVDKRMANQ
jgi:hypothetical protein